STLVRRVPKISTDFQVTLTGCGEVTISNNSEGANAYVFDMGDGQTIRQTDGKVTFRYQYAQRKVYTIRLRAEVNQDISKCLPTVVQRTINAQPPSTFAVRQTEFSLCEGEVAQLEASGGVEYRWMPTTGLSNPTIPNPIANPTTTTTYQVYIRNAFNCDTTIRVNVERVLPVVADFAVSFREVCDTVPLLVVQNRSKNGKNYEFSFSNGQKFAVTNDSASFEVKLPSGKQIVVLKATHSNPNCRQERILEKEINVPYDRSVLFEEVRVPTKVDVCLGYTATITATGGVRYEWSPATGLDNPTSATVKVSPTQNTTYTVRIFNEKGCFTEKTVPINVFPEIVLEYEYQLTTPCGQYPILRITKNDSRGATQYTWKVGEQQFANQLPANYQFSAEGRIPLTLRGENSACYEEKTVYIDVKKVVPPNVFTPNGDGFNDFFEIPSSKKGWKIEIYNRWGEKVYQSDDYQNNWDGRNLSDTEFYYIITSPEGDTCKGFFRKL
ncbi:MAG: gliding motility-associated C-terminal domain-containing protein, partial [Flammeovirgaceae bacterium]|nr:gliding motility-associated C-terminal domain-containing protein [Flammeovirgaceae bacterium]